MSKRDFLLGNNTFRIVKNELEGSRRFGVAGLALTALILSGCLDNSTVNGPEVIANTTNEIVSASAQTTPGIERAIAAQREANPLLLGSPGVVGTGASMEGESPAVVVFLSDSTAAKRIPKSVRGVPVIVEVIGRPTAMSQASGKTTLDREPGPPAFAPPSHDGTCAAPDRTARFARPVPIGVSAGIAGFSGGTYGVRVRDSSGNVYMLSNNHTFAGRNNAPIGTLGVQPRPQDGGRVPADVVGALADFQHLQFCIMDPKGVPREECRPNIMDAAILSSTEAEAGISTPCDGYGTPLTKTSLPSRRAKVMKYGRTTGLTHGQISAVNATIDVYFGSLPNGDLIMARFENQIIIRGLQGRAFAEPGDSGSLVVTDEGSPIGLLFSAGSKIGIANPINPVLERFGVRIDGR